MAIETIKQVLAPDNAPSINGVRAQSVISKALLENLFQGIVESNGRGISDKYVTEDEANANAQIFVNRILPHNTKPREMGASKNGASFSANGSYTQTETVGIEVLTVVDDPVIIPRARQDTINVDLLAKEIDLYGKMLNTIVNGATASAHLFSAWKAEADGKDYNSVAISEDDITGKNVLERFIEANSLLDEGDPDHGIDVYPTDTRIAVMKMGARPVLKANGVLMLGGSNYAQTILAGRGVSVGAVDNTLENGYWGDIDGVPCHGLSNESLGNASEFLGLERNELKKSSFLGYVASSYASARGVSMVGQTKIVDAIAGQGLVLQPFTKLGVVSWYPLGQVILFRGDSTKGAIAKLKEIFSANYASIGWKVKGAGSRLYPVFGTYTVGTSSTTVKITALDDNSVDHVVKGAYVVGTAEIKTLEDFYAAYTASGATKGYLTTLDGANSITVGSGKYLTVLAISDDGSITIASKAA